MNLTANDAIITWLMAGDPAIRWQTLRDLCNAPSPVWEAERARTLETGWGAELLALRDSDGRWGGGIYSPKWTSTTYTLLTLRAIGIPPNCTVAQQSVEMVMRELLGATCDKTFYQNLARCDRCIVGMILQLAVYFEIRDARMDALVDNLLSEMMPDGAWNCLRGRRPTPTRPSPHHSSLHTTLNVLEGLREVLESSAGPRQADVRAAEASALEFMLQHRLYKSDQTGQVINKQFTMLSFPPRWYYDILRGLDYFARAGWTHDDRLGDAIDLLLTKRRADERWPIQQKHAGKDFFIMERTGGPSRWNTLRARRVLDWWTN
jgi:hypothetical protein